MTLVSEVHPESPPNRPSARAVSGSGRAADPGWPSGSFRFAVPRIFSTHKQFFSRYKQFQSNPEPGPCFISPAPRHAGV